MFKLEVSKKSVRIPLHVRDAINLWVLEDLSGLRISARSDRIRELMFEPPVEFIFDERAWDYCLDVWLRMDSDVRDEWIGYYRESLEKNSN